MSSIILEQIEKSRKDVISEVDSKKKSDYGQYMTPISIAMAMAKMFQEPFPDNIRLLDPGAGTGSLSYSFLEMLSNKDKIPNSVEVVAYEIDSYLADKYEENSSIVIEKFNKIGCDLDIKVLNEDFISSSVSIIQPKLSDHPIDFKPFTHAILNPPYLKISSSSKERKLLEQVGLKLNNLYSAFMALSLSLLSDDGQLVGITPRSFCNGPYFKSFRKFLLKQSNFKHIHIFEKRDDAFNEEKVLQENIISFLHKNKSRNGVIISTSNGRSFSEVNYREVSHSKIVDNNDSDLIIRIPKNKFDDYVLDRMAVFSKRLIDLGLEVSTGPVVDFRVKDSLRKELGEGSVPLIYPSHFSNQMVNWPLPNNKKPNAIRINKSTHKWLFPNEHFTLVKRFSSKEEKRRIYPAYYRPLESFEYVGFENHLNIIHKSQTGVDEKLAKSLVAYLSSSIVDLYFRQFSGHTQVNARDLRSIPLPQEEILLKLDEFFNEKLVDQTGVDKFLETLFRDEYNIRSPNPIVLSQDQ